MGPLIHLLTCSQLDAAVVGRWSWKPRRVRTFSPRGAGIKKSKVMFGAVHFQERVCYRDVFGRPKSGGALLKLYGFVACNLKSSPRDLPALLQTPVQ